MIRTKEKEFHTIASTRNIQLFVENKKFQEKERAREGERATERKCILEEMPNEKRIFIFFFRSALNHKAEKNAYLLSQMYVYGVNIWSEKKNNELRPMTWCIACHVKNV